MSSRKGEESNAFKSKNGTIFVAFPAANMYNNENLNGSLRQSAASKRGRKETKDRWREGGTKAVED